MCNKHLLCTYTLVSNAIAIHIFYNCLIACIFIFYLLTYFKKDILFLGSKDLESRAQIFLYAYFCLVGLKELNKVACQNTMERVQSTRPHANPTFLDLTLELIPPLAKVYI